MSLGPPYHPNEKERSSGTPVSEDETVAKMATRFGGVGGDAPHDKRLLRAR